MKMTIRILAFAAVSMVFASGPALALTVSLASDMNPNTGLSENLVTGSIAQIGFGSGGPGDADGLYDINNPTTAFGAIDVFPNETAFDVGSLDFDETGLSGVGTESVAIDSLDLSSLWTSGSATTDLNDQGLQLWFFGQPTTFTFGALDASDTLTFTNGLLTSIDLSIPASFGIPDGAGNPVSYNGSLSIVGATISLTIADTQAFDTGLFGVVPSTFTSDLTGTVSSVGVFVVPEPGTAILLGGGLAMLASRRRRA